MKKIILITTFSFFTLAGFCQKEELNRKSEVPKELTINGKPYSQYKAEQDALKKQQEANKQSVIKSPQEISINAADFKPAPAIVQPVSSKPANGTIVDDGKTDVLKASIEMSKTVAKPKETEAQKPVEAKNAEVQTLQIIAPPELKLQAISQTLPVVASGVGEKNKVQPVAAKEVAPSQSIGLPTLKVAQVEAEPAATKVAEVKPAVSSSSDSKQQLPAKKD
ncbi:MAG: hypothetical protein IPI68_00960 [Chitinophagaceae bacterium]|nr:hypothetical protein [Chitinophagaceae bacterium]